MDQAHIVVRLSQIIETKNDPERAHDMEDRLHRDVLRAIADGAANPQGLAKAALLTTKVDFPRWFA